MLTANPSTRRRMAAGAALLIGAGVIVLAAVAMVTGFPHGLAALACGLLAVVAAWYALVHRGAARVVGSAVAVLLLRPGLIQPLRDGGVRETPLIVAGFCRAPAAGRAAFAVHVQLPP